MAPTDKKILLSLDSSTATLLRLWAEENSRSINNAIGFLIKQGLSLAELHKNLKSFKASKKLEDN